MTATGSARVPHRLLSDRDASVAAFVAANKQVTQPQVMERFFRDRHASSASRCLSRLRTLGVITYERINLTGHGLIRVNRRGARVLVADGVIDHESIFVSTPIAASELRHHTWIVDCIVALALRDPALVIEPAWRIQRRHAGAKLPIPDIVAYNPNTNASTALEVDTGTESLVVLRKKLARVVNEIDVAGVIVLTQGPRRIVRLKRQVADAAFSVPIVVLPLPQATGRAAIREIAGVLART